MKMRLGFKIALAIVAALMAATVGALIGLGVPIFDQKQEPEPVVSRADLEQLHDGMTLDEAQAVIGDRGAKISDDGVSAVVWQWINEDGTNITVTFRNGLASGFYGSPSLR